MGRVYRASFAGGTIPTSGPLDLFTIFAGASKVFRLHSLELGQITATAVNNLQINFYRLEGTITAGSGGSTPALIPALKSDAAATITCHALDTTATTETGGSNELFGSAAWNIINGYLDLPPQLDRMQFDLNSVFVARLITFPSGALTASGNIVVEEVN